MPTLMTTRTSILVLILLAPACCSSEQPEEPSAIDCTALVRRATRHRMDADRNHRPLRFLLRKTDEQHDTTREIIETGDGDVARLVAINGQPLSAEANQAELERLHTLANHPEIQQHRHQRGAERYGSREPPDAPPAGCLPVSLPRNGGLRCGAMLSSELLSQSALRSARCGGGYLPRHGRRGYWIDQAQERLTRLDAHLIANVDFGWGILGRLDKGGDHPARTNGHWRPRLGSDRLEAEPAGQGLNGQISELSDCAASQPFLLGSAGHGLPQGRSSFWRGPTATLYGPPPAL